MRAQEVIQQLENGGLLTIEEAARLLRVSPVTIWRMVKSGELPAVRVGKKVMRIRKADLAAVITPAPRKTAGGAAEKEPDWALATITEPTEPVPIVDQAQRQQAAYRILQMREKIGPIDIPVTDLIHDGLPAL